MKKEFYLLTALIFILVGLLLYKQCSSKSKQSIPTIIYDGTYVKKLAGFEGAQELFKGHKLVFRKVAEFINPPIELYNCFGEGWEEDPGDFKKIKIKLKNGYVVEYDNRDGWDRVDNQPILSYLLHQSTKIKKHAYGITLDMGEGNYILALFGHHYPSESAGLLTLIYIEKETAVIVFNRNFTLFEIREQQQGYSLIGRTRSVGNEVMHADPYEIAIRGGKLTMEKLPLQKVYEGQEPPIILHDSIGWGYSKQLGGFTRLEIAAPPSSKDQENQVFNTASYEDTWTPFAVPVRIPSDTRTIKQTSHFIILENQVGRIIILNGKNGKEGTAACLTILRSAPHYPTSLFNDYFYLQEIREDEEAYHLLGDRGKEEYPNKVYELTISKASMSEVKRNW